MGEAFAGSADAGLRPLLERQSAKFFRLYHHSNIEVGLYVCMGTGASGMEQLVCSCFTGAGGLFRTTVPFPAAALVR